MRPAACCVLPVAKLTSFTHEICKYVEEGKKKTVFSQRY